MACHRCLELEAGCHLCGVSVTLSQRLGPVSPASAPSIWLSASHGKWELQLTPVAYVQAIVEAILTVKDLASGEGKDNVGGVRVKHQVI